MKKIDIKSMEMKPFEKIGSEWMLITAEKHGKVNTMTASWGGLGILWGKPVATAYIRPQRYTKEFVDAKCGLDFNSPIELVCALILAAQCTDARVNTIIPVLFSKYKDVYELSKADIHDIAKIVKPCGFYMNKSKAISNTSKIIAEKYNGIVPDTMEDLTTLPGIGRKSANIIFPS